MAWHPVWSPGRAPSGGYHADVLERIQLGRQPGLGCKVIIIRNGYYSLGKAKEEFPEESPLPRESQSSLGLEGPAWVVILPQDTVKGDAD